MPQVFKHLLYDEEDINITNYGNIGNLYQLPLKLGESGPQRRIWLLSWPSHKPVDPHKIVRVDLGEHRFIIDLHELYLRKDIDLPIINNVHMLGQQFAGELFRGIPETFHSNMAHHDFGKGNNMPMTVPVCVGAHTLYPNCKRLHKQIHEGWAHLQAWVPSQKKMRIQPVSQEVESLSIASIRDIDPHCLADHQGRQTTMRNWDRGFPDVGMDCGE
ncbi:hypothetical protein B0H14DRAFT_2645626 [Mycena olivaceomarginata]|nr:hypothetical protein B0H14DRAFT_2645626 [Mycena olivaceomarginata]